MGIHFSFNTEELSDSDRQVLAVLAGNSAPAQSAPAAKKAAATSAKKADPVPEPDPVEEDADLVGGGATMDDAVKLATELVSNGEAAKVKAALVKAGAKKVSELPDDAIAAFIAELS